MNSKTMVIAPIIKALMKFKDEIGDFRLRPITDMQKEFIDRYYDKNKGLSNFSKIELRSWISKNADVLNKILEDEGFDIRLESFSEDEIGVVSILEIMNKWKSKAKKTKITVGIKDYPAIEMNKIADALDATVQNFSVYELEDYKYPLISINTESGDKINLTIADCNISGFELMERIEQIKQKKKTENAIDKVIFPMISYDESFELPWLLGMFIRGEIDSYIISQAKQQTMFKMNLEGALVKSAVAIAAVRGMQSLPKKYIIDRPFYLWIDRTEIDFSVLYGLFDTDSWSEPVS